MFRSLTIKEEAVSIVIQPLLKPFFSGFVLNVGKPSQKGRKIQHKPTLLNQYSYREATVYPPDSFNLFLFDSEMPDKVSLAIDDINLFELQGHFNGLYIVECPCSDVWGHFYDSNHPERAMKPFQLTVVVNYQNAGGADNLKKIKDIRSVLIVH